MRRSLMPMMPLLLLALFARPADAQVTVIRDVREFTGDSVIDRATVVIEGDRVREVASGGVVPAGAMVVEGAGRTLLPGLIDAHTHTMQPAQAGSRQRARLRTHPSRRTPSSRTATPHARKHTSVPAGA
jgi:imidazolonepropionase-like amidohydrolase